MVPTVTKFIDLGITSSEWPINNRDILTLDPPNHIIIPPVQESTLRVIPSTITWMIRPLVTTFTSPIEITTMLTHGTSATGYVPIETVLYFLYSLLIILVIPILVFQVLTAMDIKVLLNISPN